jgi:1,4-dihydroxy-2-naphthoate octaprenyltransferase
MSVYRVWWAAVRPATLAASVAPVLAGTAVAIHEGGARPGAGVAALIVALAMQLGVNFANDYSDHVRGADSARVGPLRAASSGIVSPGQVRWAAIAAFCVAAIAGVALSLAVDWRLLLVGAACLLAGWLYTGGPRPYGYLGLGEVFVFVFFGLVATAGSAYVQLERLTGLAVAAGCAVGALACALLVVNNLRDIPTDAAAGKRTLAVRLGERRTRALYVTLVGAAFAIGVACAAARWGALACLLAVPFAIGPARRVRRGARGRELVAVLAGTGRLQLAFGATFALGLWLTA